MHYKCFVRSTTHYTILYTLYEREYFIEKERQIKIIINILGQCGCGCGCSANRIFIYTEIFSMILLNHILVILFLLDPPYTQYVHDNILPSSSMYILFCQMKFFFIKLYLCTYVAASILVHFIFCWRFYASFVRKSVIQH